MKTYEIYRETKEIKRDVFLRDSFSLYENSPLNECTGTYDSEAEAISALKSLDDELIVRRFSNNGIVIFQVTGYVLVEVEDEEWVEYINESDFSKFIEQEKAAA